MKWYRIHMPSKRGKQEKGNKEQRRKMAKHCFDEGIGKKTSATMKRETKNKGFVDKKKQEK